MRTGLIRASVLAAAFFLFTAARSEGAIVYLFSDDFEADLATMSYLNGEAMTDPLGLTKVKFDSTGSVKWDAVESTKIDLIQDNSEFAPEFGTMTFENDVFYPVGSGGYGKPGGSGVYVDLDGTSGDKSGIIETKSSFLLSPGITYKLSFDLAGPWRVESDGLDTVLVNLVTGSMGSGALPVLGNLFIFEDGTPDSDMDSTTLPVNSPFTTYSLLYTVLAPTSVKIRFDSNYLQMTLSNQQGILLDNVYLTYDDGITSSAVPEPASCALFGLGLLGLAAVRRRQAKQAA